MYEPLLNMFCEAGDTVIVYIHVGLDGVGQASYDRFAAIGRSEVPLTISQFHIGTARGSFPRH